MPIVNDIELAKSIRSGQISSLYYFYGRDTATIEGYAKKLIAKLVKSDFADMNVHRIEGKSLNVSDFADVCEMLPLMSDRVCVAVNDFNADNLTEKDHKFFLEIISDLSETTTVIFYATGIDVFGGKKFLSTKTKKVVDIISKKGYVCDFQFKKPSELSKSIISKVQQNNCVINKQAAEYLATQCLCNQLLINNEIEKLCAYVNGGEITKQTVDLLVAKQIDTTAFALAKATVQFNMKRAMELLDDLYSQQIDSIPILSAISMAFIDLYRARIAQNSGVLQKDVVNDFNYKRREFAVSNAFRDSRSVDTIHLRKCIAILEKTDVLLKSAKTDKRLLIEKAIASMVVR